MGQAGKGLDHTNPSAPGSRKPALGTRGHYPPYSAGPGDPGGPGGRTARACWRPWGPRRALRPGRETRDGRPRACAFAPTAPAKSERGQAWGSTSRGHRTQPGVWTAATSVHPVPRPPALPLSQPGATGPCAPHPQATVSGPQGSLCALSPLARLPHQSSRRPVPRRATPTPSGGRDRIGAPVAGPPRRSELLVARTPALRV